MSGRTCYWTDYPIAEIGDTNGAAAPIRACKVLSYDQNKYLRCFVGGVTLDIKSGYVYTRRGRYGEVPRITRLELSLLPRTVPQETP